MGRVSSFVVLALLVLAGAPGFPVQVLGQELPPALRRKDERVRGDIADQMLKLAKLCERYRAYGQARIELAKGLAVAPEDRKLTRQLDGLEGKTGTPPAEFAGQYESVQAKAYEDCADGLVELARLCRDEGLQERYAGYVDLIRSQFPSEDALVDLGMRYFQPYFQLLPAEDAERLDAGWEQIDGDWVEPSEVAARNRGHASWDHPWEIDDGVHQVRTTMPYRTARSVLSYVTAYRAFFLDQFHGEWDLRQPAGLLPIILTATQAELQERTRAIAGDLAARGAAGSGVQGAAYYMQTNGSLDPCFVTFEPTDVTGRSFKIDMDRLLIPLAHEIGHQIAFEYSKYDFDATRQVRYQFWAVEGIANFMQYHAYDGMQWRLTHPRAIPMAGGYIEGAFAWCHENLGSIPQLKAFFAQSPQQFMTVENYHIGATVAYFFLHGEDGKYRRSFLKLLETVHKVRDADTTFDTCFAGVDTSAMQGEWIRFVNGLPIER